MLQVTMPYKTLETLQIRFWKKVKKTSYCWEWTGNKKPNGYGRIQFNKKSHIAHRLSYELNRGFIPHGLFVCHICDNPSCIKPDHLFLGTHTDNMHDRNSKGRSNMPKGLIHHRNKLTEKQVHEIRASSLTSRELGKKYDVSHHNIVCIRRYKTWKHI